MALYSKVFLSLEFLPRPVKPVFLGISISRPLKLVFLGQSNQYFKTALLKDHPVLRGQCHVDFALFGQNSTSAATIYHGTHYCSIVSTMRKLISIKDIDTNMIHLHLLTFALIKFAFHFSVLP